MRITDRYQSLMERVGPGAARPLDKGEKANAGRGPAAGAGAAAKPSLPGRSQGRGGLEVNMSDRAHELAAGTVRLDALRAAIRDGSFQVNAHAIAARLVGDDGSDASADGGGE